MLTLCGHTLTQAMAMLRNINETRSKFLGPSHIATGEAQYTLVSDPCRRCSPACRVSVRCPAALLTQVLWCCHHDHHWVVAQGLLQLFVGDVMGGRQSIAAALEVYKDHLVCP